MRGTQPENRFDSARGLRSTLKPFFIHEKHESHEKNQLLVSVWQLTFRVK
jgi:hypothetical protein